MDIAALVSERSTCLRRKVGAVLVRDKRMLCTGYNGAAHGLEHCDEVGCLRDKLHIRPAERIEICRGIHAEQNALVQAAGFGINVHGATLYCTGRCGVRARQAHPLHRLQRRGARAAALR